MTTATMALLEYLRQLELAPQDDWLRLMVQQFTQALIELEAEQQIGAGRHERSPARTTQRNGYRERGLATRGGAGTAHTCTCAQVQVSPNCARAASFPAC